MIEHEFPYSPECTSIKRYDYKYLRLQGFAFCEANWGQGEKLPALLLAYLERKADEHGIERVDLKDCWGAVCYVVSHGKKEVFMSVYATYREPFLKESHRYET